VCVCVRVCIGACVLYVAIHAHIIYIKINQYTSIIIIINQSIMQDSQHTE
jgi:hypothetical protein